LARSWAVIARRLYGTKPDRLPRQLSARECQCYSIYLVAPKLNRASQSVEIGAWIFSNDNHYSAQTLDKNEMTVVDGSTSHKTDSLRFSQKKIRTVEKGYVAEVMI
jgi:hypothetical protein